MGPLATLLGPRPGRGQPRVGWPFVLILGVAAAVLAWHAARFWFVTDDAYISLVYARNLAEHGQLVFNLGEYVEGYTNAAWTVLLAGAIKLGVSGQAAALWLGLAFGVGTIAGAMRLLHLWLGPDIAPWSHVWSGLLGVALALSASMAAWSSGGLETQLATCAMLWFFVAYETVRPAPWRGEAAPMRAYLAVLAWALVAALTRPDALACVGAVAVHRAGAWLVARRWPGRGDWLVMLGFGAVFGGYLVWRHWYYGAWLPNTYYVKATGAFVKPQLAQQLWDNGWYYWRAWATHLGGGSRGGWLVWVLAAIGGMRLCARAPYVWIFAVVFVPYVASVGGDFMGLFRFVMPCTVLVVIAATLGAEQVVGLLWQGGQVARVLAVAALAVALGGWGLGQWRVGSTSLRPGNYKNDRGIDTLRFLIDYTNDRALIGQALAPCLLPTDRAIVGGAGAQPYFARMRAIDLFGLVSREIAHGEPRVSARAGHTKVARNEVLWAYRPNLNFACYDLTHEPPRRELACGGFWRQHGFEQITLRVPGLRERGEYYTFWASQARRFRCAGLEASPSGERSVR